MSDRTTGLVVKQEPELQEDVPSLDRPETQQVDVDPVGLLLPVKLEPVECSGKQKIEIEIGPTELYKPLSFPAPQFYESVKEEVSQSDDTLSCEDDDNPEKNSAELRDCSNTVSRKGFEANTGKNTYNCTNCEYKCSTKYRLDLHIHTHTGEKRYCCSICLYRCTTKYRLDQHMHIHTGEKPYSCTNCQYKCTTNSNLVRHMRTHTGVKPYNCSKCLYKCTSKFRLVRHIQKSHNQEKKPYIPCSIPAYLNFR